jgi:hypothetical protein
VETGGFLHLDIKLMKQLFYCWFFLLSGHAFGQHVFKGQILSIVDSTPIANFHFRVDNDKNGKTDKSGCFLITSTKKKIRLATIFDLYGFDTTLHHHENGKVTLYTVDTYDSALAEFEIKRNRFRLFCGISFAPMATSSFDNDFQKQYNTTYYIVGDFLPCSPTEMASYNKVIARYLDKHFGKSWRKKIRPDVLGIDKD